jgi:hypothetical protein
MKDTYRWDVHVSVAIDADGDARGDVDVVFRSLPSVLVPDAFRLQDAVLAADAMHDSFVVH